MPFANPIVAGVELVREAIQSADYVPGVSGWCIRRDGSAEFAAGTFRGDLVAVGVDGSKARLYADQSGAVLELTPAGGSSSDAVTLRGIGHPGQLVIGTSDRVRVSPRQTGTNPPGGDLQADRNFYIGTRDQGRGLVATDVATLSTSPALGIGTALTPVMAATARLEPGRVYELRYRAGIRTSTVGALVFYRARVGGTTVVGEAFRFRGEGGTAGVAMGVKWEATFRYTRSTASNQVITAEAAASTGTFDDFALSTTPRGWRLYDIGSADDPEYAQYPEVT